MYLLRLVKSSTVFIVADQPDTSRQQPNAEHETCDQRSSKWRTITHKWKWLLNRKSCWRGGSSGHPHILDHARLRFDTADDMARHRLISELRCRPWEMGSGNNSRVISIPVFVVAILGSGCQSMSAMSAMACLSGAVKNVWVDVEI